MKRKEKKARRPTRRNLRRKAIHQRHPAHILEANEKTERLQIDPAKASGRRGET